MQAHRGVAKEQNLPADNTTPKIRVTLFQNARDRQGEVWELTWDELTETEHAIRGTPEDSDHRATLDSMKDHYCIMLGVTRPGTTRAKRNFEAARALGFDLDARSESEITEALTKLIDYQWWAYTTHKHGARCIDSKPRVRVILPLAREIPLKAAEATWRALAAQIGKLPLGPVDGQCCDATRLHYLPSTFDPEIAWSLTNNGRLVEPVEPSEAPKRVSKRRLAAKVSKVVGWLNRLPKNSPLKDPTKAVCAGEPFAEQGERHDTMLALTWAIAEKFPDLEEEHIAHIFAESAAKMDEPTLEEICGAYTGAVEKIQEEQEDFEREKREKRLLDAQKQQAQNAGRSGPYSADDLQRIAGANGWSPEDLHDRWILQKAGAYYFLNGDGEYEGPHMPIDAPVAASKTLARAPVRMVTVSQNGSTSYRPISDYVRENGQVPDRLIGSLSAQKHHFDPRRRILTEAVVPLREIAPQHDPEIERWLRILAGREIEKLLDWLAVCPDLNKLLCAIYFGGEPGGGKSLFGHGLAKLWSDGGPAELESVLGNFNDELMRCPLVFADEKITSNKWKQDTITQDLRQMVSVSSRSFKRKNLNNATLNGCIRLLLAANNQYLLKNANAETARDMAAIAERFLYIEVGTEAREYIDSLPQTTMEHWLHEGIAAHALHLQKTRPVKPPERRFWVEGSMGQMHRILMSASKWNGLICEWVVRYLQQPQLMSAKKKKQLIVQEEERLLVNAQAIIDGWDIYLGHQKKTDPDTSRIGQALHALSQGKQKRGAMTYFDVDMEVVATWSEVNLVGNPAQIRSAFAA